MGRVSSLALTACALAITWIVASAGRGNTKVDELQVLAKAAGLKGEIYRLSSVDGGSCLVAKASKMLGGAAVLNAEPECEALLPGIARARYWRERADGTVEFTGEAGDALAAFSVGDGVDYESFRPRSPLLSLSSNG